MKGKLLTKVLLLMSIAIFVGYFVNTANCDVTSSATVNDSNHNPDASPLCFQVGESSYILDVGNADGWIFVPASTQNTGSGSLFGTPTEHNAKAKITGITTPTDFVLSLAGKMYKNGGENGTLVDWSATASNKNYYITPTEPIVGINTDKQFTAHASSGSANSTWSKSNSSGKSDGRTSPSSDTTAATSATYKWTVEGKKAVTGTLQSDATKTDSTDAYVVKIIIKNGTTDITDATTDIIVGVPVSLTAELSCPNSSLTNDDMTEPEWSIPDTVAQDWTADANAATRDELNDAEKKALNIHFYWIDGSPSGITKEVTFTAKIKGVMVSSKTTFKTKRPAITVNATSGTIACDNTYHSGFWYLHYGDPYGTPGMSFTRGTITTGITQWVQTVSLDNVDNLDSGAKLTRKTTTYALDTTYPYDGNTSSTNDSPDVGLLDTSASESINQNFKMYLMFNANITGSKWVPVQVTNWSWSATVKQNGDNSWSFDGTPSKTSQTSNTTDYPKWTQNIVDVGYHYEE